MREQRTIDTIYGLRVRAQQFLYTPKLPTSVRTWTKEIKVNTIYILRTALPTQSIDREQNNKVLLPLPKDSIIAAVTGVFKFSRTKTSSNKASKEKYGTVNS